MDIFREDVQAILRRLIREGVKQAMESLVIIPRGKNQFIIKDYQQEVERTIRHRQGRCRREIKHNENKTA